VVNTTRQKIQYEKALFIQRVVAFFIDIFFVTFISSLVIFPFTDSESLEKLTTQNTNVTNQYLSQEIDANTYMNQSMDISYEIAKQSGLNTIITITIYILYYVVFQFYNKGKTFGKQIMKIRVISKNSEELTLNQLLFRAFLVNSILVDIIILLFAIFGTKDIYSLGVSIFMVIQYIFIIISAIMVGYRKDRCGIHDFVAHTEVIRCTIKEKELEVCEN